MIKNDKCVHNVAVAVNEGADLNLRNSNSGSDALVGQIVVQGLILKF